MSKKAWRAFLDALIAEDVPVLIVRSTRAYDIVRDADILHLYRKAGVIRWLLGMENTDEQTLPLIRKGGSTSSDREAIRLLRLHGILSMATWPPGSRMRGFATCGAAFASCLPTIRTQIQALYVTPHRWDAVLQDRPGPQGDPEGRAPVGLQAPGAADDAAEAADAVLQRQADRTGGAVAAKGAGPHPGPRGTRSSGTRCVLVHARMLRLVPRSLGISGPRRSGEGWPTLAEFWGAPQDAEEELMTVGRPARMPAEAGRCDLARRLTGPPPFIGIRDVCVLTYAPYVPTLRHTGRM